MKIIIDPACNIRYSSFYIQGLLDVYGASKVSFSRKEFLGLPKEKKERTFDQYMAFTIINKSSKKSYIIDFRDTNDINFTAYSWCDFYAKINIDHHTMQSNDSNKLILIPPSFGIKIWNLPQTLFFGMMNYYKSKNQVPVRFPIFIKEYIAQYLRPRIADYNKKNTSNRIFFLATLWSHDNCLSGTNFYRKIFVEYCKELKNIEFEGGFYIPRQNSEIMDEYNNISFFRRYSSRTYLRKTQESMVVFNTPAVHNCHGWKLGEFLALGKAIISMPMSNYLTPPLLDKKDIYLIHNENEIPAAIDRLINDEELRRKMEYNARSYYEQHAAPSKVIRFICSHY